MSDFFVKLPRLQDPDWLGLSPLTRGLLGELLLLADRAGRIRLGRAGLPSIAVSLRGSWADLEPHVLALLEVGQLEHDVDGSALVVVTAEAAPRPKSAAERKADQRAREAAGRPEAPVTPSHAMSRPSRDQRDVTASHVTSRRVTPADPGSRDVTDVTHTDQTNRSDQIPPTPRDSSLPTEGVDETARRVEGDDVGGTSPPVAPTRTQLVRAYVRGVETATAGTMGRRLADDERDQLEYLWERSLEDDASTGAQEFLARLTGRVAEWVRGTAPADRRFTAGWSVKRFVVWLQEQSDAARDPPAPLQASPWGEPTAAEIAALGDA